jgi:hypothetical protein
VIATDSYGDAESGPGDDPADKAGPGSGARETTTVTPFATKPFEGEGAYQAMSRHRSSTRVPVDKVRA